MYKELYTFLLTGKTGVGKSALGNSILNAYKFESKDTGESVSRAIQVEDTDTSDLQLRVIDTPGFMDTGVGTEESKLKSLQEIKIAMSKCPDDGKIAIIYVIKYGDRFTDENVKTLNILESIFGETELWKSCVVVMTMGENFYMNYSDKSKSFDDYMKSCTPDSRLGQLFIKCEYKCVLFSNKTHDEGKKAEQLDTLIKYVKTLDHGYTKEKFLEAKKEQNRLELDSKLSNYNEEYQGYIDQITENLDTLDLNSDSFEELAEIEHFLSEYLKKVNDVDSPDTVFYRQGEKRLLEEKREAFIKLIGITLKKKETAEQLKVKDVLERKSDQTIDKIKNTNTQDENAMQSIMEIEQEIDTIFENLQEAKLSKEHDDYIKKCIDTLTEAVHTLKVKVKQQKENEIHFKIQHFLERINAIILDDADCHGLFFNLKDEFNLLKEKVEIERAYYDNFKTIECALLNAQNEINKKEETILEKNKADKIEAEIIAIENMIRETSLEDTEIRALLTKFDNNLNMILESLQQIDLRADFKDHINTLLNRANKELNCLKEKAKRRKEEEINDKVGNMFKILTIVNIADENISEILTKIEDEQLLLKETLEKDASELNQPFYETVIRHLSTIKCTINDKREAIRQYQEAKHFKAMINNLKNNISETSPNDDTINIKLENFEKKMKNIKENIRDLILSNDYTSDLNADLKKTKGSLNNLQKNVKDIEANELISKIEDIMLRLKEIKFSEPAVKSILAKLKGDLDQIKNELNNKKTYFIASQVDIIKRKEDKARQEIELKTKQHEIANTFLSEINDMKIKIDEISQSHSRACKEMPELEKQFKNIEAKIKEVEFIDPFKLKIQNARIETCSTLKNLKNYIKETNQKRFNNRFGNLQQELNNTTEGTLDTFLALRKKVKNFKKDVNNDTHVDDAFKENIIQQIEIMKRKIQEKEQNITQRKQAQQFIERYKKLIHEIELINPRNENILKDIRDKEECFTTVVTEAEKLTLNKSHADSIKLSQEEALKKLNNLKKSAQDWYIDDIKRIHEKIKSVSHTDDKCLEILSAIDSDLKLIAPRTKSSSEMHNFCKSRYEEIKSRATAFLPLKREFYTLVFKLKNLPKSTWVSSFYNIQREAESLGTKAKSTLKHTDDFNTFNNKLEILLKIINDKKVRNDWEIAGSVFSVIPFLGGGIKRMMTDGNDDRDDSQFNMLLREN